MIPTIAVPHYEMILPSTSQSVTFRPYLTGEEKILLLAQEGDEEDIIRALKQVIKNCIIKPELDVDKLTTFDIEYLFIQIRSKSTGDKLLLPFKGDEDSECEKCKKPALVGISLSEIKVITPEGHNKKIQLDDKVGLCMKYPTFDWMTKFKDVDTLSENINSYYDSIISCMDFFYDDSNVYPCKDSSKEELYAFLDSTTGDQFSAIEKFFKTMPAIRHEVKWVCPDCKTEKIFVLEGVESFFVH